MLTVLAVVGGVGVAVVLGNGDAANAAGAMVASKAASIRSAVAWSVAWHLVGGLVGGTAVAATVATLVRVPSSQMPVVLLAGCITSIAFTRLAARRGLPVSASHGLFAGLAGAAIVTGGWHSVRWGGFSGWRPTGMTAVVAALVLSPLVGFSAAALVRTGSGRTATALPRSAARPARAAVWVGAAAVAVADGGNDGQKAMGVMAAALATGSARAPMSIPLAVRFVAAIALAAGTAIGGQRIIRSVSRRLYRMDLVDGVTMQLSAAAVILGANLLAAPLSTSTVVASSVMGVGASRRPGHVRWNVARQMAMAWLFTVPVCLTCGAGLATAVQVRQML